MVKIFNSEHLLKFGEELQAEALGFNRVAGIDEVGRGCLAGPVVASAVIMPLDKRPDWFKLVRDSKLLSARQREYLSMSIHETAISIGTGVVSSELIDSLGMTRAVGLAMKLALESMLPHPDYALIDYLTLPDLKIPQKGITDGDYLCFSIACASIIAKVYRDNLMQDLDRKYPGYGFSKHKGYGTREHIQCLRKLGPTPVHRRLFQPVRNIAQLSFDNYINTQTER